MIKFGLKLWSNNAELFNEACDLFLKKQIDFIELYHNPDAKLDWTALEQLKAVPITIHNTHSHGWHEFILGPEQLNHWRGTLALADFFSAPHIVVHPGKNHTFETFQVELKKIDDPRILIENMAGLDIHQEAMYAQTIEQLQEIHTLKPICFDLEKAVKAACWQKVDYKNYIEKALEQLQPQYFHISGGDQHSPVDEHTDLSGANFDVSWISQLLTTRAHHQDIWLVFETPKQGGLSNDLVNMDFFRQSLPGAR